MRTPKQAGLQLVILFLLFSAFVPPATRTDTDDLKKLSTDWMVAAKNRDEKTLNKLVATEFKLSGTNQEMPTVTRDTWMKNTIENLVIDSFSYSNLVVETIDHVAIVQSDFYWSVSFKGMPARKDTAHLIDTWMKRKQGWQVVHRIVVD